MQPVYFTGIDWADTHHDLVILDQHGQQVGKPLRVTHTSQGIEHLLACLHHVLGDHPHDAMACLLEIREGLLITALLEAGFVVYPVNPRLVKERRKPSRAKTDIIDATILARIGYSEWSQLHPLQPDLPLIAELKVLTRDQDQLDRSQTRVLNQLHACLKTYYPQALTLFSQLDQPSTIAVLRAYPTPEALRAAPLAQIVTLLQQVHYPGARRKALQIQEQAQQPALQATAVTVQAKSRLLLVLLDQLELLMKQLAAYDEEITRLFLQRPSSPYLQSLPRCGPRLGPRLLAEIGDQLDRYQSSSSLQALAGTCPVPYASGNFATQRFRRACNKRLRNALHQLAWQSTLTPGWAQAYYQRKRKEGKARQTALRELANIWARILLAMLRQQKAYDAQQFLQAQQQHRPRVA